MLKENLDNNIEDKNNDLLDVNNQENNNDDNLDTGDNNNNDNDNQNENDGLFNLEDDPDEEYKEIFGEEDYKEKLENYKKKYSTDGKFDEKKLLKALHNANKLASQKMPQAPDTYEFEKSEDLDLEFDESILKSFEEVAKQNNLTNEQFNRIVNEFGKNTKLIYDNAIKEEKKRVLEEIKSIENFQERASGIVNSLKKSLTKDELTYLSNNIHSKEMFEILDKIVNKENGSKIIDNNERKPNSIQDQIDELTVKINTESDPIKKQNYFNQRQKLLLKL